MEIAFRFSLRSGRTEAANTAFMTCRKPGFRLAGVFARQITATSVYRFTEAESQFLEATEHTSPARAETQATALQTFKIFLFVFFSLRLYYARGDSRISPATASFRAGSSAESALRSSGMSFPPRGRLHALT